MSVTIRRMNRVLSTYMAPASRRVLKDCPPVDKGGRGGDGESEGEDMG
jgi:hypothetical protein